MSMCWRRDPPVHERRVHAGALFTTNRKASVEQYAVIWVNGDKAVHAAEAGEALGE